MMSFGSCSERYLKCHNTHLVLGSYNCCRGRLIPRINRDIYGEGEISSIAERLLPDLEPVLNTDLLGH